MRPHNASFEEAYDEVLTLVERDGRAAVSSMLRPLLYRLFDTLVTPPVAVADVHTAVVAILRFLTTPEGRTDANCWAVDLFLTVDWPDTNREYLPDELNDILADMGGALHDSVEFPEIAENFDSTPEQLLDRAMAIALPAYDR